MRISITEEGASSHIWKEKSRDNNTNTDTANVFDFIVPEALQYSVSHLQEKDYSHYIKDFSGASV